VIMHTSYLLAPNFRPPMLTFRSLHSQLHLHSATSKVSGDSARLHLRYLPADASYQRGKLQTTKSTVTQSCSGVCNLYKGSYTALVLLLFLSYAVDYELNSKSKASTLVCKSLVVHRHQLTISIVPDEREEVNNALSSRSFAPPLRPWVRSRSSAA
jgi:hypothetical protein